jgi:hypothetical protein
MGPPNEACPQCWHLLIELPNIHQLLNMMHFSRLLTILDAEWRIQCICNENLKLWLFFNTSAIIASCCLMTASYMLLRYEADDDSFDPLKAFLSIRIIICARQLNESYSTAADTVGASVEMAVTIPVMAAAAGAVAAEAVAAAVPVETVVTTPVMVVAAGVVAAEAVAAAVPTETAADAAGVPVEKNKVAPVETEAATPMDEADKPEAGGRA